MKATNKYRSLSLLLLSTVLSLTVFSQSRTVVDSLERVFETSTNDSVKLDLLIRLCDETTYNDSEKAIEYFQKAEKLARNTGNDKALARAYERAGIIYFHRGEKKKSRDYYLDAYRVNEKVGDYEISASIMYNIGNLHYEWGNFDSTVYYADKAAMIFLGANDSIGYAATRYLKIGAYKDQGSYSQAMDAGLEALKIFREYGVKNWEIYSLNNIADIYVLQDDHEEGLKLLEEVIIHYRSTGNKKFESVALRHIGDIYLDLENYVKADSILKTSLEIAEKAEFLPEQAKVLLSIANLEYQRENYQEANQLYSRSLAINREISDRFYIAVNLLGKGKALYGMGGVDSAYLYLTEAQETMNRFDEPLYLKDIYYYLYRIHEDRLEYDKALSNHKLYASYRDSLLSEEKSKELAEITTKYESEKKEEMIRNLEQENELVKTNRRNLLIIALLVLALTISGIILLVIRNRKNRQLVEKSREIESLKSRFFANISHEFRTPITLILSPLYELQKKEKLSGYKPYLSIIEHNAKRLLNLVNQILDLTRLEAGHYELKPEKREILLFIRRIIASFESLAASRNISLSAEVPEMDREFVFDPEILETILNNLFSNAIKNEPKNGNVYFTFRWNSDKESFKIILRNEGSYIKPDKIRQVFDRFYTETSSTGEDTNGTGIGLALTSELVNIIKGSIYVYSEEDKGTWFELLIPQLEMLRETNIRKTDIGEPTPLNVDENQGPEKKRILLIEDNRDMREFTASILQKEFSLDEASDGREGLEKAQELIPDIIVSDIMMPGLEGTEICRILKSDEKTSHIPVILLSAKASEESKVEGLKALADDYVSKPFHPDELLQRIRNQLIVREKLREKYSKDLMYQSSPVNISSTEEQFFRKINLIIEENISNDEFSVEDLSSNIGMSRSQLHRKLNALAGLSASHYMRNYRLKRAKELIENQAGSISEIAYMTGFGSPAYFNKCFREFYGITPGEAKRIQKNTPGL